MSRVIGHVRVLDDLGRVVIPIEYRRILDIKANDEIEFIIIDKKLILKKYEGDK